MRYIVERMASDDLTTVAGELEDMNPEVSPDPRIRKRLIQIFISEPETDVYVYDALFEIERIA